MRRKFKKGPRSKEMELYMRIYRHRERQKGAAEVGFRLKTRGQEGLCQQACPLLLSLKGHLSPVTETQS